MTTFAKREASRILDSIDTDSKALKRLTNRDGETFETWVVKHMDTRKKYAEHVRIGYPPPHIAAASAEKWETMLAYCQEQAAVSRAFQRRAVAVCRELIAKKMRATEAGAAARTWEQDEERERWEALVNTLNEWLWQARATEKSFGQAGARPERPHG